MITDRRLEEIRRMFERGAETPHHNPDRQMHAALTDLVQALIERTQPKPR